jgi:DNA-binding MarR family transcriptional regulator
MLSFSEAIVRLAYAYPDMTLRQAAILFHAAKITDETARQVHKLANHFGWFRPVISRAGDRLESYGLIERGQIAGDRRTCVFTVTRSGHRAIQKALDEPETKSPKRRKEASSRVFPAVA